MDCLHRENWPMLTGQEWPKICLDCYATLESFTSKWVPEEKFETDVELMPVEMVKELLRTNGIGFVNFDTTLGLYFHLNPGKREKMIKDWKKKNKK